MYDGVILKPDLDDVFNDSCFAHYGVKGMHWGVRKAIDSIGGAIKQRKSMKNVGRMMKSSSTRQTVLKIKGIPKEIGSKMRNIVKTATSSYGNSSIRTFHNDRIKKLNKSYKRHHFNEKVDQLYYKSLRKLFMY